MAGAKIRELEGVELCSPFGNLSGGKKSVFVRYAGWIGSCLEPVGTGAVPCSRAPWSLAEVDGSRSLFEFPLSKPNIGKVVTESYLVVYCVVQLESDGRSRRYCDCLRGRGRADVAGDSVRSDVRHGRVVLRLTNSGRGGAAACDERGPDI